MRFLIAAFAAMAMSGCMATPTPVIRHAAADPAPSVARGTQLPHEVQQGALVIGTTQPGAHVEFAGRQVRVSPDGVFVVGIARDAPSPAVVVVDRVEHPILVQPRDWPVERVSGVPPETVRPPPEIAARIEREQAQVAAARTRDDARTDFAHAFLWPVEGRISGRFGNRRTYVLPDGTEDPQTPHSGMDIAARAGTPVRAPAGGLVTFAAPDLYLTGGTLLIDHGHGVSSNFLHLSRIDVRVGDRVEQGQVIGAVGATGRASGPHLHWGMNWFDVRVDPLLVLPPEATR
ncbi:M23 family metallopeptidase [Lysobacter sp. KIS68-7]|uniref:M23 family metallopeptidase n=1 Tax=Lysobacter sp. KIS68-7 TaxID=2904252 RepID=UPI001E364337|nr:M23 family metallopeptidase [Lysobacter sp. KIS68-7]UHQ18488.1 M23 family metallopeptidase [Lysobacter sp. KIS68-7]